MGFLGFYYTRFYSFTQVPTRKFFLRLSDFLRFSSADSTAFMLLRENFVKKIIKIGVLH